MRILIIIDSFSFGGAENLLAVLARAAPGAGLDLQVASLAPRSQGRNAMLPVLEQAGLAVSYLDVPRLADPTAVPRMARAIRESGCDVVHAHLGYSAILAPIAARLAGRPCVATLHHVPEDETLRERMKEWLSVTVPGYLGTLVLVSEASRREFARRYRVRPGTTRVVHNGVDLGAFSPGPQDLPADVPVPPGAPVVSIVAALRAPKGHHLAIDAWPAVLDSVPDARLLVVGDGPERGRLEQQVLARKLTGHVVFAGAREDVPRLLRASTLVALPSLTEALPTSLIEAAACGRAVVATDVGGVREVVEDGRTGLVVPAENTAELSRALVRLLLDDSLRARMGAAGCRLAEDRFDMHRWAARLRQVYDEAVAGHAATARRAARRTSRPVPGSTSHESAPPSSARRWRSPARRGTARR